MKKLQNNFTTPEQSKRLLELGVPADSADIVFLLGKTPGNPKLLRIIGTGNYTQFIKKVPKRSYEPIPCWSVGRLIEICLKCSTLEQRQVRFFCNGDNDYYDFMDYTINVLESGIMTNQMDFSKLED